MRALVAVLFGAVLLTTAQCAVAPESYWKAYFRGMREPALPSTKVADGDFQFRWTRLANSGEPLTIRVWRTHGRSFARAVRLEFRYDFSVGHITRDHTLPLSDKQVTQLRSLFASDTFWRPYHQSEPILGGAHWLFEMQDASGYHFVSLFSPVLLVGDAQYRKTPSEMQKFRRYIATAGFLLRTSNIFPDEHDASY